jgi:hypothetical protein
MRHFLVIIFSCVPLLCISQSNFGVQIGPHIDFFIPSNKSGIIQPKFLAKPGISIGAIYKLVLKNRFELDVFTNYKSEAIATRYYFNNADYIEIIKPFNAIQLGLKTGYLINKPKVGYLPYVSLLYSFSFSDGIAFGGNYAFSGLIDETDNQKTTYNFYPAIGLGFDFKFKKQLFKAVRFDVGLCYYYSPLGLSTPLNYQLKFFNNSVIQSSWQGTLSFLVFNLCLTFPDVKVKKKKP